MIDSPNFLSFQRLERGAHVAEGVGHAGMPGGGASHLRGVIGNQYAVVAVAFQDAQDAQHVDVTFINKGLLVVRHLATNIPEVDVGEFLLATVGVDSFVNVALGHFR